MGGNEPDAGEPAAPVREHGGFSSTTYPDLEALDDLRDAQAISWRQYQQRHAALERCRARILATGYREWRDMPESERGTDWEATRDRLAAEVVAIVREDAAERDALFAAVERGHREEGYYYDAAAKVWNYFDPCAHESEWARMQRRQTAVPLLDRPVW